MLLDVNFLNKPLNLNYNRLRRQKKRTPHVTLPTTLKSSAANKFMLQTKSVNSLDCLGSSLDLPCMLPSCGSSTSRAPPPDTAVSPGTAEDFEDCHCDCRNSGRKGHNTSLAAAADAGRHRAAAGAPA